MQAETRASLRNRTTLLRARPASAFGVRALGGLVVLVAACGTTPTDPARLDAELERLTSLLAGDYFSAADAGAREGRPIYMRIRRIEPPDGRRHALYAEMRHDGPDGEIYRQRIYLFDDDPGRETNTMVALGVSDSTAAARLDTDPGALARGDVAKVPVLADGCEMTWHPEGAAFVGRIDPARCEITGRRGNTVRIEGVTRITADSIGQLERGYSPGGALLFGNPDAALYVWPRVEPPDLSR
jgi:hypothetical protein